MKLRCALVRLIMATSLWTVLGPAQADDVAALTREIQAADATAASHEEGLVTTKIASRFESFAGSAENATNLVRGLRSGSEISLTAEGESPATFTPPTRPMGYGNVSTSLALAQAQLAQQGISNPTPPQLQTALMGGAITENGTTVEYAGILQLRADGKGWGEIAHSVGLKLGPIVSGMKAHNQGLAAVPSAATHRIHSAAAPRSSSRMAEQRATGNTEPRSRGIVTAEGTHPKAGAAHGHGKGHRGVATTDAGRAARGQGIVTAAGHGASPGANGAAAGKGPVATAAGGTGAGSARGAGNHKALGHGKK